MDALREIASAIVTLIALLMSVVLALAAVALLIGFWPLVLLIAAGGLYALAKWAAGVRD